MNRKDREKKIKKWERCCFSYDKLLLGRMKKYLVTIHSDYLDTIQTTYSCFHIEFRSNNSTNISKKKIT
jgi:hypothetical protein